VLLFSSDPSAALVAPFGGTRPVLTPNPVAAGIPAEPDPILIDISTSITTAGQCARARNEGRRLPRPWLLTASGEASDDPNVLSRGGSIQPLGGIDHGHKGYALAILVECLTQGLGGFGRAEQPTQWGAAILVLAAAPGAFAGAHHFIRETNWISAACRASPPVTGGDPVRLPGQLALARKREALKSGVLLYPSIERSLAKLASSLAVNLPRPLS
jgi:L-lactate dehydrogenase